MVPKISVLMSAYNAEKYIGEAIKSVLNQTFTDFEVIIINDGSNDATEEVIKSFHDKRIRYFSQTNHGVSKSLNRGLQLAVGKYIAKLDADDVCYSNRLEEQFNFMEKNPDYVVCGSFTDVIDEEGSYIYTYKAIASSNDEIQKEMLHKNSIVHSSSFYVREIALSIGGYYEPIRQYFEDYMFFYQLVKKGKAFNFERPLIKYRITAGSVSSRTTNRKYIKLVHNVIRRGFINDEEKKFLFAHRIKKAKKHTQLSNHYLQISRLILMYQLNVKESHKIFVKAIISKPLNPNIIKSGIYMWVIFLIKKFNKSYAVLRKSLI